MSGAGMSSRLGGLFRNTGFAIVLLIVLLVVNLVLSPARFHPAAWGALIGLSAPLIGAAAASAPVIIAGRGGIDISVGPLMGFVNAMVIQVLFLKAGVSSPIFLVPAALLIGGAVGAVNGFLATIVRIQPIVATLGTYLVLTGVTLTILPAPIGPAPGWLKAMAGTWSALPLIALFAAWWIIRRLPYYDQLMAIGSDDRAAYTAGIDVTKVRFIAYVMTGLFAAVAGLMLTALIGSADPNIGQAYTLIAIAAVALGGVSLAGGRGGLVGAAIGAIDIFLLQSVLTSFNVSTYVLQITYGAILVAAVILTAVQERSFRPEEI
ncbi:ribose transport system permease protein [Pararhizobium capsulatum DSM 1112]|uniref:Ribose transport system permease protein n=1 Tax=Pararhizobium capsulatum DSM 1112 TaxID=1121113 RepID=A0ABU0BY87_9HYPH|nr:ABC transporter permease [Pararhizobium capsulatum]MDQ0323215.1 ribose transport system permease protein [Pararhizobium capsulatum DSM 1112]